MVDILCLCPPGLVWDPTKSSLRWAPAAWARCTKPATRGWIAPSPSRYCPSISPTNPQLRERFEREARAVSSLNHPHICTLHDVGQQDGIDYLVMEYLEGETLAQRLKKGPLPLDQALRYAIEIAGALDHAHRHGVIHRDLKPGNIMLTKAGAKVLDFGLAKVHAAAATPNVTQPTNTLTEEGVILGTLQYMAPEQLEGKEADARSDIFAFGAVVYEMATGKKAFEGKSRASVMAAILEREPPPISSLQSLTPPALDHVVRTCLAKDPDARRQTAHDVMLELQWIAEGGSQAGVPAPVVAHRRNRERLAWAVAGIAVAAAIVLGFVSFRRPPSDARLTRFIVQAPEGAVLADEQATGGPAISPDGRLLALVASRTTSGANAQPLLWVRALDSLSAQPLSGTEGASFPFWSPDSRFIGFFAQGKLKKIDVAGRSVQTICDAPEGFGTSAWNQEGVILFSPGRLPCIACPRRGACPPRLRCWIHLAKKFPTAGLNSCPTAATSCIPLLLPIDAFRGQCSLRCVPGFRKAFRVGSKDRKRLLSTDYKGAYAPPAHGGTGHLLFWRDNSLMAQPFDPQKLELTGEPVPIADQGGGPDSGTGIRPFSISENGVLAYPSNLPRSRTDQMVWYDRAGKRLGTVGEPGVYGRPRLSPDQKQLAVDRAGRDTQNAAVWLFDLTRNTASRFTFHPGMNGLPIWSPDGSRIVFTSNWEGAFNLYQKAASGAGSEELILKASSNACAL